MGIRTVVECDICGKQKQQTNNWFMANINVNSGIIIDAIDYKAIENKISIPRKLLCGEACVIKYVSQNLASLHPPKTEPIDISTEQEAIAFGLTLKKGES